MRAPVIAAAAAALVAPAGAHAATLTTTGACFVEGQTFGIAGEGWTPGSNWAVTFADTTKSGTAPDGTFAIEDAVAPEVEADTPKPRTFTITGTENGATVATTTFQVVNFLMKPRKPDLRAARKTTWVFSGFLPGRRIYFHVKRGRRVYTRRIGRTAAPCGTLKKRMRLLPAVPRRKIRSGAYRVFADHRRTFSKGGYQFSATITID